MVIAESPDVDALLERFLLPSAPAALVIEVRRYLEESQGRGGLQASSSGPSGEMPPSNGLQASGNGISAETPPSSNGRGSLSHRNPWHMLHVAICAPRAVVDIAYDFRRRSQAVEPVSFSIPASASPVQTAAAQPVNAQPVDANDRLKALATPFNAPSVSTNGVHTCGASIEAAPGGQRYGIAECPLRVGTDAGCDVVIPDSKAVEARIWPNGDRYILRVVLGDVRVEGEVAGCVVLDDGDILEIGDAMFIFRLKDTP
jgi:hypothetical protein